MTNRNRTIRLTAAKVDELMLLFRTYPKTPVGGHLTEEQFAAYVARNNATRGGQSPRHPP